MRNEVFRYFPKEKAALDPLWSEAATLQGRTVRKVSFDSFDGLRVRGLYSLPAGAAGGRSGSGSPQWDSGLGQRAAFGT